MSVLNKVLLIGNLTRDPELRRTPRGVAVCQLGLALNEKWRDKDGNDHEEVTFVDVDAFGRQAETIAKYLTKGRPLLVEGGHLDAVGRAHHRPRRGRRGGVCAAGASGDAVARRVFGRHGGGAVPALGPFKATVVVTLALKAPGRRGGSP